MLELTIAFVAGFLSAVGLLYWIMKKPKGPSEAEMTARREFYRQQYQR